MASKRSLEAAAATSGMFTAATEQDKPKKESKQEQPKNEKGQQALNDAKRETVTFSVKIGADTLKKWRIYASMDGYGDKGKLTEAALIEYMNRHKLNPEQQAKLDTLLGL